MSTCRKWKDIDDWHWTTQLNQARAVAFGIEHFRSLYPLNTGAIVWQLNDNWPVVSWAAVDGHGIRKPLWFALKRVYAERLLTVQPRSDEDGSQVPALIAHNDSPAAWDGELVITRCGTGAGTPVLAEQRLPLHLDARSAITVALDTDVVTADDETAEFLMATVAGDTPASAFGYFVEDTALQLVGPDEAYEVDVLPVEGATRSGSSRGSGQGRGPVPGPAGRRGPGRHGSDHAAGRRRHTFAVTGSGLDEVALTGRPVLRSVNDLR